MVQIAHLFLYCVITLNKKYAKTPEFEILIIAFGLFACLLKNKAITHYFNLFHYEL